MKDRELPIVQEYVSKYGEDEKLNNEFQKHVKSCCEQYMCEGGEGLLLSFYDSNTVTCLQSF